MLSPWNTLLAACGHAKLVVLAAPYMKAAMLQQLLDQVDRNAELECFTRWTPHDILVGATDTACRAEVIERGGKFYLHNRLHAKYYRFDDRILIGSANVTAAGLNYRESGNLEILHEPEPSFDRDTFENSLRTEARQVTEEEFQLWLTCPVEAPRNTTIGDDVIGISLEDWKPLTRFPEYLWLIHNGQEGDVPNGEQKQRALADLAILNPPKGLPKDRFYKWVAACLMASPFVSSVIEVEEQNPPIAWEKLADRWGLDTRAAARARSTVQNWIAHFRFTRLG